MTETDFLLPPHYELGKRFTFASPKPSEWTIMEELTQQTSQKYEADIEDDSIPSYASATFCVRNDLNAEEAFMRVYLQVPNNGTVCSPRAARAKQADSGYHEEFEAMMAFYDAKSTVTPALIAWKFVFECVPGVRLAENKVVPGYGAPLHTFFQKFKDTKCEQIRSHFDEGYRKLQKLGWEPEYPWADHLIWDSDSTKLYFVDFRDARKTRREGKGIVAGNEKELEE